MSVINAVSGASATAAAASPSGTPSFGTVANQDFLTLLVAQLKAQDPTNPMNSSEFMTQLSQLTEVNSLNAIQSTLQTQQSLSSAALLGKTVVGKNSQGQSVQGVVTDVQLNSSGALLQVNGQSVLMSSVTDIKP